VWLSLLRVPIDGARGQLCASCCQEPPSLAFLDVQELGDRSGGKNKIRDKKEHTNGSHVFGLTLSIMACLAIGSPPLVVDGVFDQGGNAELWSWYTLAIHNVFVERW